MTAAWEPKASWGRIKKYMYLSYISVLSFKDNFFSLSWLMLWSLSVPLLNSPIGVWVLFNGISTFVGHLMPRKVRWVLSSTQVLGHFLFIYFFYSSWFYLARYWWKGWFCQISVKGWGFLEASKCSQVWFGWFYGIKTPAGHTMPNFVFAHIKPKI